MSIWIDNVDTTETWRSSGGGTSEERHVVTIGMDEEYGARCGEVEPGGNIRPSPNDADRPRWEYENRAIAAIANSLGYVGHITDVHFGEVVPGALGTKYIDVTITVEKEW